MVAITALWRRIDLFQSPADDLLARSWGEYMSAVSKKLIPASSACRISGLLLSSSSVQGCGATVRVRRSSCSRARAERPPALSGLTVCIPSLPISMVEALFGSRHKRINGLCAHLIGKPMHRTRASVSGFRHWRTSRRCRDARADEVPIAFGRQVLRLTWAELGRTWDGQPCRVPPALGQA